MFAQWRISSMKIVAVISTWFYVIQLYDPHRCGYSQQDRTQWQAVDICLIENIYWKQWTNFILVIIECGHKWVRCIAQLLMDAGNVLISASTIQYNIQIVGANTLNILQARSNITQYWTQYDQEKAETLFRIWTHKGTSYFALMDEQWGIFCETCYENVPRDNDRALYVQTTPVTAER